MKNQELCSGISLGIFLAAVISVGMVGPSYANGGLTNGNFKTSKGGKMSFIKFMNAPENHGVRDMRSLKKRYARYRSGSFEATDTDGSHRPDLRQN